MPATQRKKAQITIHADLKDMAIAISRVYGAVWGNRGNPAQLVSELFSAKWLLIPNRSPWAKDELKDAATVIQAFQECETQKRPFIVKYEKAQGAAREYLALFGQIVVHGDRLYLDIFTDEENPKADLPELSHNRSLRLDRIHSIIPVAEETTRWVSSGLQSVLVTFELNGQMATGSYQQRNADITVDPVGSVNEPKLRVTRQVNDLLWFTHDIIRYRSQCEVISPDAVRQHIKSEVEKTMRLYQEH